MLEVTKLYYVYNGNLAKELTPAYQGSTPFMDASVINLLFVKIF